MKLNFRKIWRCKKFVVSLHYQRCREEVYRLTATFFSHSIKNFKDVEYQLISSDYLTTEPIKFYQVRVVSTCYSRTKKLDTLEEVKQFLSKVKNLKDFFDGVTPNEIKLLNVTLTENGKTKNIEFPISSIDDLKYLPTLKYPRMVQGKLCLRNSKRP